jgi:proton-translocating NADH-quinone oxidoreductase, chain M
VANHLLSVLIWLPIVGGALVLALGNRASAARWTALAVALATLVASLGLLTGFDYANPGLQFVEQHAWIPAYDIHYNLGVDGIAVALILLTTIVTPLTLIGAWTSVQKRVSQYVAAFLLLEGVTVGIFAATDAILFYVFFEAMLIPMFLIIGVWGGPRRIYAAMKFFLYTFLGSVLMLVALVYLYLKGGSFQLADLYALPLTAREQTWLFFAFAIAFAVKVPMFPVHTGCRTPTWRRRPPAR